MGLPVDAPEGTYLIHLIDYKYFNSCIFCMTKGVAACCCAALHREVEHVLQLLVDKSCANPLGWLAR